MLTNISVINKFSFLLALISVKILMEDPSEIMFVSITRLHSPTKLEPTLTNLPQTYRNAIPCEYFLTKSLRKTFRERQEEIKVQEKSTQVC